MQPLRHGVGGRPDGRQIMAFEQRQPLGRREPDAVNSLLENGCNGRVRHGYSGSQ